MGNLTFDEVSQDIKIGGTRLELPRRERALLRLLVRRAGKPVAREAIESALFAFGNEVGPNALEVYIHRLRRRLLDIGATISIRTERGIGYMLVANDPLA